ncbi:unnamed protein product, partial [Allacma fusca]
SQSEQEKSCILLLRLRTRKFDWIWIHCVLQVKEGQEAQQSVIVATNQVLSEQEAGVMRANAWIYHYYSVQTKLQYGLAYPEATGIGAESPTAAEAPTAYFPSPKFNSNSETNYPFYTHAHFQPAPHHPKSPDSAGSYSPMPHSWQSPENSAYAYACSLAALDAYGNTESPIDFSRACPTPLYDWPPGCAHFHWPHQAPNPSRSETSAIHHQPSNSAGFAQSWSQFSIDRAHNNPSAQFDSASQFRPPAHSHLYLHPDLSNSSCEKMKTFESLSARGNGASKWGQKRKTKNREVFSENIE